MTRDLAAYGVVFAGLDRPDAPEPPPTWPRWTVLHEVGPADDSPGMDVWDHRARIGMPMVGEFRLDRATQQIVLRVREPWPPEVMLHPGLAPAASVIAHWMGRASLHAAAVVIDGLVWGLLGGKGAGKSTTVAHLVALGCGMVTDDLLVVDGLHAFAGPGFVDLRSDAGLEFGGQPLGVIGSRDRWRAELTVGALSTSLGGWIQLAWSDGAPTHDEVGGPGRLAMLDQSTLLPPDGPHLLTLAELPMFRLARRHSARNARVDAARLIELVRASRTCA